MKQKKHLGFNNLRKMLSSCFRKVPEHRQKNKVEHTLHDTLMSGFACMYFQDGSLLQFQKRLQKKHHKTNLQTLFDVKSIPESTQLRAITDQVESDLFSPFFNQYTHYLQRGKQLAEYQLLDNLYYIPMDGTEYFSSYSCSCHKCLKTKSKKRKVSQEIECNAEEYDGSEETQGVRYSHKALQIAILHPDKKQVIPLMPEEISNQDGATKQDCEVNAAKRLIPKLRQAHPQLGIILGGDDLFSRQPMIEEALTARMHYIFVAKPESHVYLLEWLDAYPTLPTYEKLEKQKKVTHRYVYRWMNQVPLHGGEESIQVNYFEITEYAADQQGKERVVYRNSWVTDLEVKKENIIILARAGRCRWKIENECFNTLKNQGYAIDHSYGHGDKNLCFNFYLLTLIAFAFHQVHELSDQLYQACRQHFGSKKHLWENLRANLRTFIFESWELLLKFTLNPEDYTTGELPACRSG